MAIAAVVELILGVDAEQESLEDVAAPQIRRELETRFWGPGRLRAALVEARRRGLITRSGRSYSA